MVHLKGHQPLTASGLQKSETREATSENSALSVNGSEDHSGDDCLPEAQSSLLEPDEDRHNQRKSVVFVSQNNTDFVETACSQEPEQVSVNPGEAHAESRLLASAQLHEKGLVSTLPRSSDNCCGDVALPVSVAEGQSDPVVQNVAGQTLDLNSQCVKTDFERLEPISNGHVLRPPEDLYPIHNLDSSPTLVVHAAGPDSGQKDLHLPRIVKHKPSSITFLHYNCPSGADGHGFVNESSDDGEYSPGYEKEDDDPDYGDDDDGDVFKELPQSRELLVNHRQRSKDEQKRRGAVSARTEIDYTTRNCGYEAEGESSSKEVCCYLRSSTIIQWCPCIAQNTSINKHCQSVWGSMGHLKEII